MPHSRSQKLALVALALLCGALMWRAGHKFASQRSESAISAVRQENATSVSPAPNGAETGQPVDDPREKWLSVEALVEGERPRIGDSQWTNRFRNTAASLNSLIRNDRAILLRNALVDTAEKTALQLPAALRADGEAGAYIVQARGGISEAFRKRLQDAGLEIISYIPNNAYLVRGDRSAADQAARGREVAAVLPFEPAFKLEPELLGRALDKVAVTEDERLILTLPDPENTLPQLKTLGVSEVFRERGPFGPVVTVAATSAQLADIARVPGVQLIERWIPRQLANDLAGVKLGSVTNADNTGPYLGLDGEGVLININDTGVDKTHPDLQGRVSTVANAPSDVLTDPDGHGTHVAATIAGDGTDSGNIGATPQGSTNNASFQGKAPKAKLFVLPVDLIQGPPSGDAYLQEEAAHAPGRTNRNRPLISNNSWAYVFARDYDTHSASYDAAVRDALPRESGSQPILYVFAAGNEGLGGNSGVGGVPDSIPSPGNAKNVITVGALESFRNLTNAIIYDTNGVAVKIGSTEFPDRGYNITNVNYFTNEVLKPFTDTDYQIAGFSSRGNVGIGIEGESGRFKPDVVAPGTFILSARSALWKIEDQYPADPFSGEFPDAYYLFGELEKSNAPSYRFESGTSMATPAISGLLAQMQQYFEQRQSIFPSASSYKALLINSAVPTSEAYSPDPKEAVNYAGWGQPTLPVALRGGFTSSGGTKVVGFESPDGTGLATGQAFKFSLKPKATNSPVRLTLVWTDPPGHPSASTKLVNDLDLVVSNVVTGEVFSGNDLSPGSGFANAHTPGDTNNPVVYDRINNVERITLPNPLSTEYVVMIVGHRINVNALPRHPNQIAQDFSLAIASDAPDGEDAGSLGDVSSALGVTLGFESPTKALVLTNGASQTAKVGANSPLLGGPAGTANQWRFYVVTNVHGQTSSIVASVTITNTDGSVSFTNKPVVSGSNVLWRLNAIANLSRGRTNGPDLDLYVSRGAISLTNLDQAALDAATKSTSRSGNEQVIFTNSADGEIFSIGVKSEDQQSGEFELFFVSSDTPFGQDGGSAFRVRPLEDGSPDQPGVGRWIFAGQPAGEIRRVFTDLSATHENYPDLFGQLSLRGGGGGYSVVLDNHSPLRGILSGTNITVSYDDSGSGSTLGPIASVPSDGPGSLAEFAGLTSSGLWEFAVVDNARGNVGDIDGMRLRVMANDFGSQFVNRCVRAGFIEFEVINVPADASKLTITITNQIGSQLGGPLEVYVRRDAFPDLRVPENNDKFATILPPNGGDITLGIRDVPPLQQGRYFIVVYNPNGFEVCYRIRGLLERALDGSFTRSFTSTVTNLSLADDALTTGVVTVDDTRRVTAMEVGIRAAHPRASDLAIRLVSPQEGRAVLFENRGGLQDGGLGAEVITTNTVWQHVALTYERASQTATLYVNARRVATGSFPDYEPLTAVDFFFGRDHSGKILPNRADVGLDDIGLWRRALRPSEIQIIYLDGQDGIGKTPASFRNGLLSVWPLDNRSPNNAVSATSNLFTALLGFTTASPDRQIPGRIRDAMLFRGITAEGVLAYKDSTKIIDVGPGTGFTIEAWVRLDQADGQTVVGGYAEPNGRIGPSIFLGLTGGLGNGPGSVSAILGTNAAGQMLVLKSASGIATNGVVVTNTVFASFNDDTNRSRQMIKFVEPPFFGLVSSNEVVLEGNFDEATAGPVALDGIVDGWRVTSGTAAVLSDAAIAHTGSQFLALSNAAIVREFGAAIGQRYRVGFVTRRHPGDANDPQLGEAPPGAARSVAPLRVLLNGDTNLVITSGALSDSWVTNYITVRSVASSFTIELRGGTNAARSPGFLIDSVVVEQVGGTVSYLPEEPLTPVQLGNAAGQWRLDLADGRAGQIGELLNWALTLTFAPTNPPAYKLENGAPYTTNTVDDFTYFLVDVPPEVFAITNSLTGLSGGPFNLWFSQSGIPDGNQPEDYLLLANVSGGSQSKTLFTNSLPSFKPGQRYYLGVQNTARGTAGSFTIQVDFGLKITPLTNAIPFAGTNLNKGFFDYYYFDVSPQALSVQFALSNLTDNVNLVVSKAPQLPTRTVFAYASTNSGTTPEVIQIDPLSQPVSLTPGRWYLGVYPATGSPTDPPIGYSISATELKGDITPLTNGIPVQQTINDVTVTDYYFIDFTNVVQSAIFGVSNLTADVDIYLTKGLPLPSPTDYLFASTNAFTTDEFIALNSLDHGFLLGPGRWYLAVVHKGFVPVTYTVYANFTEFTDDTGILLEGVPVTDVTPDGATSKLYRFDVPPDYTTAILFELYDLDGDVDMYVAKGGPPASTVPVFSSIHPGLANEMVVVRTNVMPQIEGSWYVEVRPNGPDPVTYTLRAITRQDGILIGGIPIGSTFVPSTITWNAIPGELYQVQYCENLGAATQVWLPVAPPVIADRTQMSFDIPTPDPGPPYRFFRVIQLPNP